MNGIWAFNFSIWCFPNETCLRPFGSKILIVYFLIYAMFVDTSLCNVRCGRPEKNQIMLGQNGYKTGTKCLCCYSEMHLFCTESTMFIYCYHVLSFNLRWRTKSIKRGWLQTWIIFLILWSRKFIEPTMTVSIWRNFVIDVSIPLPVSCRRTRSVLYVYCPTAGLLQRVAMCLSV